MRLYVNNKLLPIEPFGDNDRVEVRVEVPFAKMCKNEIMIDQYGDQATRVWVTEYTDYEPRREDMILFRQFRRIS